MNCLNPARFGGGVGIKAGLLITISKHQEVLGVGAGNQGLWPPAIITCIMRSLAI